MAKRNVDGDLLVNRLNVGLAKHKKLMASWSGLAAEADATSGSVAEIEEDDFRDAALALGHEQLGVGGRVPKEVQDGTFARRTLSTNDKLLQQLIGKKAAKAHILKREAPKANSGVQNPTKAFQAPRPEESEDDEDGRAATFKSKRRKTAKPRPAEAEDAEDGPEPTDADIPVATATTGDEAGETTPHTASKQAPKDKDSDAEDAAPESSRRKPKSGNYLDELLAERAKKRKNKQRINGKAD